MTELSVELGERSYPIRIGNGFGEVVEPIGGGNVLLVSDSNVAPLHAEALRAELEAQGRRVGVAVVPIPPRPPGRYRHHCHPAHHRDR